LRPVNRSSWVSMASWMEATCCQGSDYRFRTYSTWTRTDVESSHGTAHALRRSAGTGDSPGAPAPRPGRAGALLRGALVEIRRLAGIDLHAGPLHGARQTLAPEIRGRMPGRVRRDVPGGLRRLQLLPVPQPGLLARALRRHARLVAIRLQSARGDHCGRLAAARPIRSPGRSGQRIVPRRPAL